MMSSVIFLLVLGLIIFGPKKTLEFAQEIGRLIAHMKRATDQFTSLEVISASKREETRSPRRWLLETSKLPLIQKSKVRTTRIVRRFPLPVAEICEVPADYTNRALPNRRCDSHPAQPNTTFLLSSKNLPKIETHKFFRSNGRSISCART